jgi:hypothetical protein
MLRKPSVLDVGLTVLRIHLHQDFPQALATAVVNNDPRISASGP